MKILMATMGLDIGGAETHIVELSKQLVREGHEVIIASNGGVYVPEIESVGIKHYAVPMHVRKIAAMMESRRIMRGIIKAEQPDIVHAHARIPAFICSTLKRSLKFTFVTTAHWVFDTSGILKYLTRWGQKTVAVSDDISDYLTKNYGVRKKDIFVTINGIDTEKFSPEVSGERIIKEFGLDAANPIISHVSRLDDSRALAARKLIAIAPALCEEIDGVQILIAGGGDVFGELKAKADEANRQIGRRCIVMAGPRTDISEIVAAGDVFVGVSRAALEAMAASKPVVVAGNEGYIGVFMPEKLEKAIENNFCCRGCPMTEETVMLEDLVKCLTLTDEQKTALGEYGRSVIFEHYSVNRMARDCMAAYTAALPKKSVVMSGYYGFNNLGDEAILQAIHTSITEKGDVQVTVLSANPEETSTRYGCDAVHRFKPFAVIRAIAGCDVLVSGGGSLMQDKTSTRSILYYLSIIRMAEILGKKVMLYANGVGPVNKKFNRRLVRTAVMKADVVTLRDEDSADELRRMGVVRTDMHVAVDPVFTMTPADTNRVEGILVSRGMDPSKPFVAVSVRPWMGEKRFCREIAKACDEIVEKHGLQIMFVVMQAPGDTDISRRTAQFMRHPSAMLDGSLTATEMMGVIGHSSFVLSMRLHSLIFAGRTGVPMIGMIYDPKTDHYLRMFNMPSAGNVETLTAEDIVRTVDELMPNREKYAEHLGGRVGELEKLAFENDMYFRSLLEK